MNNPLEDIAQQQREQDRQVREDARVLQALIAHPGWPVLVKLVEAVAQNYYATVMRPVESVFEVTKPEYAKGTLNGLTLAMGLPQSKIEEAKGLRRDPNEPDEE